MIDSLADEVVERNLREFVPSHNGADMVAKKPRSWHGQVGCKTLFITPASP